MNLVIRNLQIPECRKLRQFITDYYPHLQHHVIVGGQIQDELPLEVREKEEKPLHTYYCLFLPLGIYCGFGAENIHHAYNKAAKYWGKRNPLSNESIIPSQGLFTKEHRLSVYRSNDFICLHHKEVTRTLMTKLVKAWREENS